MRIRPLSAGDRSWSPHYTLLLHGVHRAGTQILTGANTYTGGTTVAGGTLQIGNGTTKCRFACSWLACGGRRA